MKRETFLVVLFLGIAILLCLLYFPVIRGAQDIQLYAQIGQAVGAAKAIDSPFVMGYYPPVASTFFWILNLEPLGFSFAGAWAFVVVSILIIFIVTLCVQRKMREAIAFLLAFLFYMFLGGSEVLLARYDVLVFFLLLWSVLSFRRRLWARATLAVTLAATLKIVPLLVLPLVFLCVPKRGRLQALYGVFLGACVGIVLPYIFLGREVFLQNLSTLTAFHGGRGVHIESIWSGFSLLLHALLNTKVAVGLSHFSVTNFELGTLTKIASVFLVLAGSIFFTFVAVRRRAVGHAQPLELSLCAILLWACAWSPVLSPQYLVWTLPIVLMLQWENLMQTSQLTKRDMAILVLSLLIPVLSQWIWPFHYQEFAAQTSIGLLVIHTVRNISIVALSILLIQPSLAALIRAVRARVSLRTCQMYGAGISAVICLFLLATRMSLMPKIVDVTYVTQSTTTSVPATLPVTIQSNGASMTMTVTVDRGLIGSSTFRIRPDDCLDTLTVNGENVDSSRVQFCGYGGSWKTINLAAFLQPGKNTLQMFLRNTGGDSGAHIEAASGDPLLFIFLIGILLSGSTALLLMFRLFQRSSSWPSAALTLFVTGVALRLLYVLATPYEVRGHDTDGHIEYILYLLKNGWIPSAIQGWEFHQAPLYYALAALWMSVSSIVTPHTVDLLRQVAWGSFALSILTLAAGLWVVWEMFPRRQERLAAIAAGSILVTLPALIFLAARISNDTLATFFLFLSAALILRWWREPVHGWWLGLCLVLGLAILTKQNGLLFLSALGVTLLCARHVPWRKRMRLGLECAGILILIAGWFYVNRLFFDSHVKMIPFGDFGLNGALMIPVTLERFFVFNPLEMIKIPFVSAWDDVTRRQFFWEYLFRSAFFGEFNFGSLLRPLASTMIASALLVLCIALIGFWNDIMARRKPIAMLQIFLWCMIGAIAFHVAVPCACTQDIRYSLILLLPFVRFVGSGILTLPKQFAWYAFATVILCSTLSGLFIVALQFT